MKMEKESLGIHSEYACHDVYGALNMPVYHTATNLTTKGESIEFSTPTIEGTVLRRNKVDGQGKHPWKAEVTEGDAGVSASTITNWYQEVYEPSYAAAAAASLDGEG